MLDLFRRKAQSPYIQATILIIILVFVFWGVGGNQGNQQNAVATVNDENIDYQSYQKEYDQTVSGIRNQFGGALPNNLLESLNIKEQVINKLIQRTLVRQGAVAAGLYVSDQELRTAIQDMEVFKNNGVFDNQWYKEVLAGSRLTVSKFEGGMRYDMLSSKVIDHLSRFSQVAPSDLQALFDYNYEEIKLDYAAFAPETFTDSVEVNDENLTAFFEENKDRYRTEAQIKLNYLLFSLNLANAADEISEAQIEQYYQSNITKFTTPEQRQASHILLRITDADTPDKQKEVRAKAEDILAKAKAGEEFAVLAKMYSEDGSAARGGDLGLFSRGQMVAPFEDAVFSMNDDGEISNIVQTQFGLHIIQLNAIHPARIAPLDEVKSQISATIGKEKSKTEVFTLANKAYEDIILSGSLTQYAQKKSETEATPYTIIQKTDFFSQQNPPQELLTLPSLVNTAFSLKEGELSSIIETSNGYAIIYVETVKKPEPQELDVVKEQVTKDFISQKADEKAKEAAESMLSKLQENDDMDFKALASAAGAKAQTTPYIAKAKFQESKLPSQVLSEGITLTKEQPLTKEIIAANNTYYVIHFIERQAPDQELLEEKKAELTAQLAGEKGNELLSSWVDYLQKNAKVTVNKTLL